MSIGFNASDPIVLKTYVDRFRIVFKTRMVSITFLGLAVAACFSVVTAAQFIALHYTLFGLYIWSVEHCARRVDQPGAVRRLKVQSLVLGFLIACHTTWLGIHISAINPELTAVSILLLITVFVLTGLQVHLSRISFLICILPPIAGLAIISKLGPHSPQADFWGAILFCFAIIAASWRQQVSDEQSAMSAAELSRRNGDLQAALEQARAAIKSKTDFLAVTSHEVRTPLNAVLTMAGVLGREAPSDRHAELAKGIELAGGQLLRLLNGILDFTKAEAGKAVVKLEPMHITSLLETVRAVWAAKCEEAGVRLEIILPEDASQLTVEADAGRVEQTLVNLLSNAVKLTPPGGDVKIMVRAHVNAADRVKLRFEVSDRGPGVPVEDRERIFEAFEQGDAGRAAGGTGLGLAICKSNVQLMGGAIGVEPNPDGGAIFWFVLDSRRANAPVEASAEPAAEPKFDCLRILAAEDHPTNREVLRLLISPLGASLEMVEDGAQAVKAVADASYDLILMDAKMPTMDGETAVRQIRSYEASRGRRTPIAMITANVFEDDLVRYREAGADRVLAKPINMALLHECIAELALLPDEEDRAAAAAAAAAASAADVKPSPRKRSA